MPKMILNIDDNIKSSVKKSQSLGLANPVYDSQGKTETIETNSLNLDFLKVAGSTINGKRESELQAIDTMLDISKESQTCMFSVLDSIQDIQTNFNSSIYAPLKSNIPFEIPTSIEDVKLPDIQDVKLPDIGGVKLPNIEDVQLPNIADVKLPDTIKYKPKTEGLSKDFENINTDINKAKESIKVAKTSINKFLESINPMKNGTNAIQALAQFLLCPEESFIADILNAFESIVDIAKNLKPKQLLQNALMELSNHIIGRFPVVNNLMNFFNNINRYFNAGGDRVEALDLIQKYINKLGNKYSKFDDYSLLDLVKDLLDPSNSINKLPIGGNGLPKDILTAKCSALGKLIAQLESSYRAGHKFDDIIIDASLLQYVGDKQVRTLINNTFNVQKNVNSFSLAKDNAMSLGYHDKTAINSTLSTIITTGAHLNALDAKLDEVRGNPVEYNNLILESNFQLGKLKEINEASLKRMISMNEGLTNIKRKNDFLDISSILEGKT